MSTDLTAGIVRILKPGGTTAGTGFVVSSEGLIATCAHVVQCAGDGPDGTVRIAFHATGETQEVEVKPEYWRSPDAEDVAILYSGEPLQAGVTPLLLGSSGGTSAHPFKTFGFPEAKGTEGMWGYGLLGDKSTEAGFPVLQLTGSTEVTVGFSGGPVLNTVTRRIVGMVTSITSPDKYGRLTETAFIIPAETLREICPLLRLSDVCPYQGLAAFTEADADLFFGREKVIADIVKCLRGSSRFLAIVGPSGSGKSSVVQAGLFPALRRGEVPGSQSWDLLTFRPGIDPFAALAAATVAITPESDPLTAARTYLDTHPQAERLVLLADQFEELFALCPKPVRQSFLDQILALLNGELPVTVVLALRADFYDHLLSYGPLSEWLKIGQVNVPPMGKEDLKAVVEKPAQSVGLGFEPGLAESIVEEATQLAQPLPLLEAALDLLWQQREEGVLTHAAYHKVGQVAGAISRWAEDTYSRLSEEEQSLAQRAFTRLVHYSDEETGDTRQKRPLVELVSRPDEREAVHKLIQRLAGARLVVTDRNPHTDEETVEIIHDALLSEWRRLRLWVEEQRAFYLWRQRLDEHLREWKDKGHDEGVLLRSALLNEAEPWLSSRPGDLNPEERRYIQDSVALREREKKARERLRRRIMLGLAIGLVVTFVLAVVAWGQRNSALNSQATAVAEAYSRATAQLQAEAAKATAVREADSRATAQVQAEEAKATAVVEAQVRATAQANAEIQRAQAVEQRNLAVARQLGSQAELLRGADPTLFQSSVLLAIESLKRVPTLEGDTALRSDLAILPEPKAKLRIVPHFINGDDWDIGSVALSPDGKWLAAVSLGSVMTIWDTTTWAERRSYVERVDAITFSPDSSLLVYGTNVMDPETGKAVAHLDCVWPDSLDFSPDGTRIATTADGIVQVCDPRTGARQYTIPGGGYVVKFSPDSSLGAAAGLDTIVVWDAKTGAVLTTKKQTFRNPNASTLGLKIGWLAFSPDSKILASGEWMRGVSTFPRIAGSGEILIWEAATGHDIVEISVPDETMGLQFSSDGKHLAAGNADGTIRLWDASTGVQVNAFPTGSNVVDAEFLGDGQQLVYINAFGAARVIDVQTGAEIARMTTEVNNRLTSLATSGSSSLVAVGDIKGNVWLWKLAGQETARTGVGTGVSISAVAFSPDGKRLLVGAWNRTARVVDAATGAEISGVAHSDRVLAAVYSPDGQTVATGSQDGTIQVWNPSTGRVLFQRSVGSMLGGLVFSPDGKRLAAGEGSFPRDGWFIYKRQPLGKSTEVIVWEVPSGQEIARLPHPNLVNSLAFSPDGRMLATGGDDGTAQVWDVAARERILEIPHQKRVNLVAFSPDGKQVASAESCFQVGGPGPPPVCSPVVKVWDAVSGKEIWHTQLAGPWVSNLLFSPDGRWLATANSYIQGCPAGSCEFAAQIWDALTGRLVSKMVHADVLITLAFSPDGRKIASGGSDGTLRIWDPTTGAESSQITGVGSPWSVAFSPDGRSLAVGGYDSGISYARIVPVEPKSLIEIACSRLTRNLTPDEWSQYLGDEPLRNSCPAIAARIKDERRPDGQSLKPLISPDGRYIFFQSSATNLLCGEPSRHLQFYLYDRETRRTTLISATPDGQPADADAEYPQISPDWHFVLFTSQATNLIASQTSTYTQTIPHTRAYLVDLGADRVEMVATSPSGLPPNGDISSPSMSEDARFIVFQSRATNLLPAVEASAQGASKSGQIYVYDRQARRTDLVSADPYGQPANGEQSRPMISADGRYIAFESTASNLIPHINTGGENNIYVYDQITDKMSLVTRTSDGKPIDNPYLHLDGISSATGSVFFYCPNANLDVEPGTASANYYQYDLASGHITATYYSRLASNLLWSEDRTVSAWYADWDDETDWYAEGGNTQVFYRDESTGIKIIASVGLDGKPGNGLSQSVSMTADGRFLAWVSLASNLVAGDTNVYADVFVWDAVDHSIQRVSMGIDGQQANGHSYRSDMSSDGRFVVFESDAKNLIPEDQSEYREIFAYDRLTGETLRVSEAASCPNDSSVLP